VNNGRHHGE
jgi:hypothetical protein